jgi:hypothetical protein
MTLGCKPLPELRLIAPPPRAELLEQLRSCLGHAVPGVRVLAENLLGIETTIDFVALEPTGRVVLILVGVPGEDLELVGRGLAQRAWVAARLGDWIQLAPNLGIQPGAEVRVLLLCSAFGPESRAAVQAIGREVMAPLIYRCVENGTGFEVLLEHVSADEPATEALAPRAGRDRTAVAPFRTGLTDADLGLTPEERHEFD